MKVHLRTRKYKNGNIIFYLDYTLNGVRHRPPIGITLLPGDPANPEKKRAAENIRSKFQLQLELDSLDVIPQFRSDLDFISYFLKYLTEYDKKDVRKVRYSLDKFIRFAPKKVIPFKALTPKLCSDYMYFLKNKAGLTGETPYDYWKAFKRCVGAAKEDRMINIDPTDGIVFKGASKQNRKLLKPVLSLSEMRLMYSTDCKNAEVKRAFLFGCYTGLGEAEMRVLTWSNIQNNKLVIEREKSNEQLINDLHPDAIKLLGKRKKGFIFNLPSTSMVSKHLKKWVIASGISKNISFYCCRHTFAVQLLLNGANIKTVADLLGHADLKHVTKYLNYVDELKTEAVASLGSISA